jgi:hypothetical protein
VHAVFEPVVNQRDEAQKRARLVWVAGPVQSRQQIAHVRAHAPLGVAATRLAPGEAGEELGSLAHRPLDFRLRVEPGYQVAHVSHAV